MNVLRGWLFDNLGLKFIALLLAVGVYLNVYTDRPASMLVTFPLEFIDLADTLSLTGAAPATVQAELRGTRKQLILLRVKEPRLKLSLANVGVGRYERALVATDLPLTPGGNLTVESLIGPRMIELELDRRTARELPVAARLEGTPATGFAWSGTVSITPPILQVSGPARQVAAMDSVRLGALSIEGRRDTVRAELSPDGLPDWCTAEPPTVRVRVPIVRP